MLLKSENLDLNATTITHFAIIIYISIVLLCSYYLYFLNIKNIGKLLILVDLKIIRGTEKTKPYIKFGYIS